jgi:spermidine synthase
MVEQESNMMLFQTSDRRKDSSTNNLPDCGRSGRAQALRFPAPDGLRRSTKTAEDVRANPKHRQWRHPARLLLVCGLLAFGPVFTSQAASDQRQYGTGPVEYETESDFSHIRIRRQDDVRSLMFVDDRGEEIVESAVDLKTPHNLLVPYTRFMFASFLFRAKQERVLIVGLGGGAMVHFLEHYAPQQHVDVIEIDPAVVEIAEKYYGIRSGGNVRIITSDGFEYLRETEERYDVIYMDAFLRPCPETDHTGSPLRLRTAQFLKGMQDKLNPDGLVVFNLHSHATFESDVAAIRDVFPQTYVFDVPLRGNRVAVASMNETKKTRANLKQKARELDRDFQVGFSFSEIVRNLRPISRSSPIQPVDLRYRQP